MNVTLRKIGNSEGVIMPKEVLERLNLKAGDSLTIVEQKDGIRLVPSDDRSSSDRLKLLATAWRSTGGASGARQMTDGNSSPVRAVEAMHAEQLRGTAALPACRDENALESALARPQNKAAYGEPDVADLAAAYLSASPGTIRCRRQQADRLSSPPTRSCYSTATR